MAAKNISDLEASFEKIEEDLREANKLISEKTTLIGKLNIKRKNWEAGLNEIKNKVKSYGTIDDKKGKMKEFSNFLEDMKNIPENKLKDNEKSMVDDILSFNKIRREEIENEVKNLEEKLSKCEKEFEELKTNSSRKQIEYEEEKKLPDLIDEEISFLKTLEKKIREEHDKSEYVKMYFLLNEFKNASEEFIIKEADVFEENLTEKFDLSVKANDDLAKKSKEIDDYKNELEEKKKEFEKYKNSKIRIDNVLKILSDPKSNKEKIDEIRKKINEYTETKADISNEKKTKADKDILFRSYK